MIILIAFLLNIVIVSSLLGGHKSIVPVCKGDMKCDNIAIKSADGITIRGWWFPAENGNVTAILLHGVQGNRLDMLDRASHLNKRDISVCIFDFRSHGESDGDCTTFGINESNDVDSMLSWVKATRPTDKVYILGQSMGAAALAMSNAVNAVNGVIFEQMYLNLDTAIKNRIEIRTGHWSRFLSIMITWQSPFRFGKSASDIRTDDRLMKSSIPKLFIAGEIDRHATLIDVRSNFDSAMAPKMMRVMPNVGHLDLANACGKDYYNAIDEFIK